MNMQPWDKKLMWHRRGTNFLVEVKMHTVVKMDEDDCYDSKGVYRWCVYAYIYPKHPHFAKFDGNQMWQPAAVEMPFHCGPSFLSLCRGGDGPEITAVQVGADYDHLDDERYTNMASEAEASRVFADANELFDYLEARSKP